MSNIIIAAPSWNPQSGGTIVLHKLCDILNNIGYKSSLSSTIKLNGQIDNFIINEDYNTPIATQIDINNDIVIYPEIERGNPFGCKNVVRYILNKFHLPEYDDNIPTWGGNDYWLYFHKLFYDNIKPANYLHIIDSKTSKFIDLGLDRDIESCFTYRKKQGERNIIPIIHPSNSIEIGFHTPDYDLINIFNRCKRFYSYDTETYLSVLASLCGCESVIVPYKNIEKEHIVNNQPSFKYGIAYGLDDLEYALSTRHLLKTHLQDLEKQQLANVKDAFVKITNHFNL